MSDFCSSKSSWQRGNQVYPVGSSYHQLQNQEDEPLEKKHRSQTKLHLPQFQAFLACTTFSCIQPNAGRPLGSANNEIFVTLQWVKNEYSTNSIDEQRHILPRALLLPLLPLPVFSVRSIFAACPISLYFPVCLSHTPSDRSCGFNVGAALPGRRLMLVRRRRRSCHTSTL